MTPIFIDSGINLSSGLSLSVEKPPIYLNLAQGTYLITIIQYIWKITLIYEPSNRNYDKSRIKSNGGITYYRNDDFTQTYISQYRDYQTNKEKYPYILLKQDIGRSPNGNGQKPMDYVDVDVIVDANGLATFLVQKRPNTTLFEKDDNYYIQKTTEAINQYYGEY